jgi:hypothetical protein
VAVDTLHQLSEELKTSDDDLLAGVRGLHRGIERSLEHEETGLDTLPASLDELPGLDIGKGDTQHLHWTQVMQSLGYADDSPVESGLTETQLAGAVRQLCIDLVSSVELRSRVKFKLAPARSDDLALAQIHAWIDAHEELMADITEALALDDRLQLFANRAPVIGESGIRIRLLHAQLMRLQLYHGSPGAAFSARSQQALLLLARQLGRLDASQGTEQFSDIVLDQASITGQLDEMLKSAMGAHRNLHIDEAPRSVYVFIDVRSSHRLERHIPKRRHFRKFGHTMGRRGRDELLEELVDSPRSKFLGHLIILMLLRLGVAEDVVSAEVPGQLGEAINRALESYRLDPEQFLFGLDDPRRGNRKSYVGINLTHLVEQIRGVEAGQKLAGQADLTNYRRNVRSAFATGDKGARNDILETNTDAAEVEAVYAQAQTDRNRSRSRPGLLRHAVSVGRFLFRTGARILQSAILALKRAVSLISRAVSHLIQGVTDLISSAVEWGRKLLQTIMQAARPWLHFVLMGRPMATRDASGHVALVDLDFDKDGLGFIDTRLSQGARKLHRARIAWLTKALVLSMEFMACVISVVTNLARAPLGWVRATWVLLSSFRSLHDKGALDVLRDGHDLFAPEASS